MRKDPLVNGQVYHIISRSIAGYKVFPDKIAFQRVLQAMRFYNCVPISMKFSKFNLLSYKNQQKYYKNQINNTCVDFISYVIMPTHIHLVVKQNAEMQGSTVY